MNTKGSSKQCLNIALMFCCVQSVVARQLQFCKVACGVAHMRLLNSCITECVVDIGVPSAVGVAPRGSADVDILVSVQTGKRLQLHICILCTNKNYTRQVLMRFILAHHQ